MRRFDSREDPYNHNMPRRDPPMMQQGFTSPMTNRTQFNYPPPLTPTIPRVPSTPTYQRPYNDIVSPTKKDFSAKQVLQVAFAEFLGTAILMFIGCLPPAIFQVVSFGFGTMLAVQIFGHISGAHLNPAVTIGAIIMKEIDYRLIPVYIVAQLLGALGGFATQYAILEERPSNGSTIINEKAVGDAGAIALEMFGTMLLVLVYCTLWDKKSKSGQDSFALKLGFLMIGLTLVFVMYTGASFNSFRSIVPALINDNWTRQYVFWLGPNLGGAIAGVIYRFLLKTRDWQEE